MGKKNEDNSLKGEFPCVLSLKHQSAVFPMAQQRVALAAFKSKQKNCRFLNENTEQFNSGSRVGVISRPSYIYIFTGALTVLRYTHTGSSRDGHIAANSVIV